MLPVQYEVVECSSESPKHPASNTQGSAGKWVTQEAEAEADLKIRFEKTRIEKVYVGE